MTSNWNDVGRRLRVTRLALCLSEQEAAELYCISIRTLRRWETVAPGQSTRLLDCLIRLYDRYGVSIDWIVFGDRRRIGRHLEQGAAGKIAILPVRRVAS